MIESDPGERLLLPPAGGARRQRRTGAGRGVGEARRRAARRAPLAAIFNTHWHLDHTGGNDVFGKTGAKIVAHENYALWMSTEYYVDWQDTTYEPRSAEALPTDTFFASDSQPLDRPRRRTDRVWPPARGLIPTATSHVLFRERNVLAARRRRRGR
jgi:glyoxylase-like metal-dependent hydrolase (beta-lactamase superfamily II)